MFVGVYWVNSRNCWGLAGHTGVTLGPYLGHNESYWDLLGSVEAGSYRDLLGCTGLLGCTAALLLLGPPEITDTYWCIGVLLGPHWDLTGLSGTHWGLMGFAGFSWTLLMIPSGPLVVCSGSSQFSLIQTGS